MLTRRETFRLVKALLDCLAQQHVLETRYLQATLTRKDPRTTETRA